MRSAHAPAVVLAVLTLLALRPPASAASDVVVGSEQKRTYDCAGGTATITGGYNVVTFRNCTTVTVKGGDNTVDAGLADTIEVRGADNTVTWTERADGRRPRIANRGGDNVITSRKAPAGTTAAPPASAPAARPAPAHTGSAPADTTGRVLITPDGVKVQGSEGSVTVGAGGTVTIKENPSGGKIRVDQDKSKGSYDCKGASAVVNGDHNELTFRNCDQLAVNGHFNTVDVRGVAGVTLNGGDNKLLWEEAADGSRPKITDNGRGNTVTGKR